MALPASGLAKSLIKQAYNATVDNTASALPWEDDSGSVSDTERYSKFFKFTPEQPINTRITTARSWVFLESFELCFGSKAHVDNTAILDAAMSYVEGLPDEKQFISPAEYQAKTFRSWQANMVNKLPPTPENARQKFVWHLRFAMPGWYSWAAGRSDAFTAWVQNNTVFGPDAVLNCWEMVFFAAVKAGLMDKAKLGPAYAATTGNAEKMLFDAFQNNITTYKTSARQPVFEAGDIVISDIGGPMHHVFAVADELESDLKIVQLWGEGAGAGTTFYSTMNEFFGAAPAGSSYHVLKL